MARTYKKRVSMKGRPRSAAQQAATRKAQAASALKRSARARNTRQKVYATEHAAKETTKKLTPYARINRHSQSVGLAARHKIPGTDRRFVAGINVRVEKISRTTVSDKFVPHTTVRHGRLKSTFAQHKLFDQTIRRRGRSGGRSSAV